MSKHHKDYTKFSNSKPEEKVEAVVEEVVETTAEESIVEVIENVKPSVIGVVVDCARLNVRVAPNAKADVICVVNASMNLIIDEEESTDEFYAVCTESGAEGYCMKKFIQIIP